MFIKYCVFALKFCDFSELCQFYCSAGFLPAWSVYTHWHRGWTEKGNSPEYFKIFKKTPQHLMNTLYIKLLWLLLSLSLLQFIWNILFFAQITPLPKPLAWITSARRAMSSVQRANYHIRHSEVLMDGHVGCSWSYIVFFSIF